MQIAVRYANFGGEPGRISELQRGIAPVTTVNSMNFTAECITKIVAKPDASHQNIRFITKKTAVREYYTAFIGKTPVFAFYQRSPGCPESGQPFSIEVIAKVSQKEIKKSALIRFKRQIESSC